MEGGEFTVEMLTDHPLKDPRNESAPRKISGTAHLGPVRIADLQNKEPVEQWLFQPQGQRGRDTCANEPTSRMHVARVWTSTVLQQGLAWPGLATPTSSTQRCYYVLGGQEGPP